MVYLGDNLRKQYLGMGTWGGEGKTFLEEVLVRMTAGAQPQGPHERY